MNEISPIDDSKSLDPALKLQEDFEIHPHSHPLTLNEIQLRACKIHFEHGGVCGGYTLDDWLEAERELAEEREPSRKNDHVH